MKTKIRSTSAALSLAIAGLFSVLSYASIQFFPPVNAVLERLFQIQAPTEIGKKITTTIFIPLPPLVIPVNNEDNNFHVRLEAQVETLEPFKSQIVERTPVFLDSINSFIRTAPAKKVLDPNAFLLLRLQLLRRLQILSGEGVIKNLLITKMISVEK